MLVLVLFLSLLTLSKGAVLFIYFMTLYCAYRYLRGQYTRITTITFALIIISTFLLFSMARQGTFATQLYKPSYEYFYENNRNAALPTLLQPFFPSYMYMTTPLSNFAYLVEINNEQTNGAMTLWPIISTFQLKRLYDFEEIAKQFRLWPYNTHTFLADFFLDFGTVGLVFLPIILGLLVYFMYVRSLRSIDVLVHAEYMYFSYAVLMMFFSNHFTSIAYPLRIVLVFEVCRMILGRLRP